MTKCTIFLLTALVLLGAKCEDNYYYYEEGTDVIKYSDLPGTEGDSDAWTAEAKNDLVSGDKKGFGWQKKFVNDIWGFFQAALKKANETPDDVQETADSSQILDAVQGHEVSLTKLADGTANITRGNVHLFFNPGFFAISDTVTYDSASISKDQFYVHSANGAVITRLYAKGLVFDKIGGDYDVTKRTEIYNFEATAAQTSVDNIQTSSTSAKNNALLSVSKTFVLVGIPKTSMIHSINLRIKLGEGHFLEVPVSCETDSGTTDVTIANMRATLPTSTFTGSSGIGTGSTLIVNYDSSLVS